MKRHAGTLYIVPTPIGNLEDITLRALRILKEVDFIACEDTRHSSKLLNHYQITTKLISHHEHNEKKETPRLISILEQGHSIALISDAGTPLLSDPGYPLVLAAAEKNIPVVPLPGPSSIITSLSGAGLATDRFLFLGFLSQKKEGKKKRLLESIRDVPATIILLESPYKLLKTLKLLLEVMGDRYAVLAHELTKIHESFIRGKLSDLLAQKDLQNPRGEWIILVERDDLKNSNDEGDES